MSIRRLALELGKLGRAPKDPKAWAHALRNREQNHGGQLASGARMTPAQRAMWRAALNPHRLAEPEAE